jgi:hypothetical protein
MTRLEKLREAAKPRQALGLGDPRTVVVKTETFLALIDLVLAQREALEAHKGEDCTCYGGTDPRCPGAIRTTAARRKAYDLYDKFNGDKDEES